MLNFREFLNMTDLISREAAIALLDELAGEVLRPRGVRRKTNITIEQAIEALTNMPSAKLTPRHKDWVPIP